MDLNDFIPFLDKVGSDTELIDKASSLKAEIDKLSSAFIEDIEYKDLPKEVKKEVDRFVTCKPETKLIHYGMVVKELLDRVDSKNYETAKAHVQTQKIDKDELYKKIKDKYVLIINEKVVDGHHLICKAEQADVTSSLNILDLTPARFQKTSSISLSLWDILKSKIN